MRILGVDCGSECTGYGVVESDGSEHRLVDSGEIHVSRRLPLQQRLVLIARQLREVIHQYQPAVAAVEGVFTHANMGTALKLAHVRGVVLLTAAECGLEVVEYSPQRVKNQLSGYGRAEKGQVRRMVEVLLKAPSGSIAGEDASDALAVALCYALELRRQDGRWVGP